MFSRVVCDSVWREGVCVFELYCMRAGGLNDSLSLLGDPGSPVDPPFRGGLNFNPPPSVELERWRGIDRCCGGGKCRVLEDDNVALRTAFIEEMEGFPPPAGPSLCT